jgi:hypothetical protein
MSTIADILRQLQMQQQMGQGTQSGFPSLTGSNEYGIRDLAGALLGADVANQQGAYDEAAARQRQYAGMASDAIGAGAASIRGVATEGLDEIRSMIAESQGDFDAESKRIRRESRDRYLGDTASQLAGAGSQINSRLREIDSDPMLTPAQKAQLKTEARGAAGAQTSALISAETQAYQDRTLATDMNLLNTEVGLRQANIGHMQAALQRQQSAFEGAAQLEAQGYMSLAQLEGQADGVVSLFGSLAQLAAFEQNTRLPLHYTLTSSTTDVYLPGGAGTAWTRIPTYQWGVKPGTGIGGY